MSLQIAVFLFINFLIFNSVLLVVPISFWKDLFILFLHVGIIKLNFCFRWPRKQNLWPVTIVQVLRI